MKTIGAALKEARVRKKYSRARLEEETKIKEEFIEAIEREDWKALPEYPVILGFVKSMATTLRANQRQLVALLRRDYPPKKISINPKPDVSDKFSWSPKLTFFAGVVIVVILVLVYLGFQYTKFISPPILEVERPGEGEVVSQTSLLVSGRTNPQAVVKVNNQPVLVEEDGDFLTEIEIIEGTEEIEVRAISRSGKETTVRRRITVELAE